MLANIPLVLLIQFLLRHISSFEHDIHLYFLGSSCYLLDVRAILSMDQYSLSTMADCVEVEEKRVKNRKNVKQRSQTAIKHAQQSIFAHADSDTVMYVYRMKQQKPPGQHERSVNGSKLIKNGGFTETRYF